MAARARLRGAAAGDDEAAALTFPGICLAPQYVAEDLLRAEGFTDVEYVEFPTERRSIEALALGRRSTSA